MEIILLLLVVLVVIVAMIANRFTDNSNPYPFVKRDAIYTTTERAFLKLLEQAVGNDYKIMTRVRLTDVVETKSSVSSRSKNSALMKASAKSIDFLLCNKETMAAIAAVDLVNNASNNGHKSKSDWFVSGALESAGIPHIRIKVKAGYKAAEVRACIDYKLGKKQAQANPRLMRYKELRNMKSKPAAPSITENTALAQA